MNVFRFFKIFAIITFTAALMLAQTLLFSSWTSTAVSAESAGLPGRRTTISITQMCSISLPLIANEDQYTVLWKASGHGDSTSDAFNRWNEEDPPEIPVACARCHSRIGFLDYLGEDGSPTGVVDEPAPLRILIDCPACHNTAVDTMTSVQFHSGMQITSLGREAHCMVCHQGRNSTPGVDGATSGYADDELVPQLGFINPHYLPAGATLFGTEVKGAYEYSGKAYRGRYIHVQEYDTCLECHEAHSLNLDPVGCTSCHPEAITADDFKEIRYSVGDFDGDGDQSEGLVDELTTMRDALLPAIQGYASGTIGQPIVYARFTYPYFFKDTNGNGIADPDETVSSNSYNAWTPLLLRAAYNYQWVTFDYGGYTHNGLYLIQILYDSLQDIGADMSTMIRP